MEILLLIISVIVLICFFVLAVNVSAIKETVKRQYFDDAKIRFHLAETLGDDEGIYIALMTMFYFLMTKGEFPKEAYKNFKRDYEAAFNRINKPFPQYPQAK